MSVEGPNPAGHRLETKPGLVLGPYLDRLVRMSRSQGGHPFGEAVKGTSAVAPPWRPWDDADGQAEPESQPDQPLPAGLRNDFDSPLIADISGEFGAGPQAPVGRIGLKGGVQIRLLFRTQKRLGPVGPPSVLWPAVRPLARPDRVRSTA